MCVRYSPAECAEYGCATKIGTLLYSKNALLVAFSTATWFPSSYLHIPLPANMQEVVKITRGCVARKISATSGAQVNTNRQ